MSTSPKRKVDDGVLNGTTDLKKPRLDGADNEYGAFNHQSTPDSLIDNDAAIEYWTGIDATVAGVLGGFPQLSRIDLQSSGNFITKLRRRSKHFPPGPKLRRAVDCGAGIGRITAGLLVRVADTVDVVEPVKKFTDTLTVSGVGNIYNVGMQDWDPARNGLGPYDLIWHQWCCNQLTEKQLEEYFARLLPVLSEGGWIVVKENISRTEGDIFDEVDSSVTRTDAHMRGIFDRAGLKVVATELQKGFLKDLYPVRTYALQPK